MIFRQDCVYQAFRGPPKEDALKNFFDRLRSQDKPKNTGGAIVSPPASSSSSSGADLTDNSRASSSSASVLSPTGSMQVNGDSSSSSVFPVDGSADASTAAASSSSGKNDFPHSKEQSSASSTPGPVTHADEDISAPGSTHNVNGSAARMGNSNPGSGEQKPRSDQESNPDLAELLKLGTR